MGVLLEAPEQLTDDKHEGVKEVGGMASSSSEPINGGEEGEEESAPKLVAKQKKKKKAGSKLLGNEEIGEAAKCSQDDGKPKKKKKKKVKKKSPDDEDGTIPKKTKKKKKKIKKKTAVEEETVPSSKVIEGDEQVMPKSANNNPTMVSSIDELQQYDDIFENPHDAVESESSTTKMEEVEPQTKIYKPIFGGRGSLSSTKKPESLPDTESIHSKLSEFETAWREADNSKQENEEEPVPPDDEAFSLAETILDSAASGGGSTFNSHGQYAVISNTMASEEKAKDLRRQAISLAAAETRLRAEARNQMVGKSDSNTVHHGNWRLPDGDDGTEQPVSASSSSRMIPTSQEGKQAYFEGVKAASILDNKRHQPGAFRVTGSNDNASNPAGNEENDVVVAAVTEEDEAQLEKRVMQRLLKETAQASVILVEHGGNSQKYEDPIAEAGRQAELENYKPQGLVEKMFGVGQVPVDVGAAPDDLIKRRNHIPFTIKLHGTTNLWVTSIQTSQKASDSSQYMYEKSSLELKRSIKTYIATTEQEAYEIGLAMAPPIMNSYDENPICQLCSTKFALLKRPCQCRNCGVVVCSGCACSWSSKQVPSTYNMENRSTMNVCVACDWLATSFREALLKGDLACALSLYKSGNVNLRKLHVSKKKGMMGDEAMYPIQMAIRGGNLSLVKWLMFEHYCPLYESNSKGDRGLLKTSKGRTVVDLALEQSKPEILKFLVTNQGVSLTQEAKKETRDSLKHLTCLVQLIPETMLANVSIDAALPTGASEHVAELPESSRMNPREDEDQCAF
ncbi:unnamed protein product [Cylindrotheca closterium]|uniref:FYVE-type domain-containing protein n=1 Tax=Cylindrotheca closterium TaxID=2856 RepID=A0AAD2FR12_9STRA|nr:unnamed protein product [Cylindrotheca closterium]